MNAIRFPLGLTSIKSPAASPLVGQELVYAAAGVQVSADVALLAVVGVAAVCYGLWRWPPNTPGTAARFTGLAMALAIVLAPATRFGYLIYPVNLLTWAYLLRPDDASLDEPTAPDGPPSAAVGRSGGAGDLGGTVATRSPAASSTVGLASGMSTAVPEPGRPSIGAPRAGSVETSGRASRTTALGGLHEGAAG